MFFLRGWPSKLLMTLFLNCVFCWCYITQGISPQKVPRKVHGNLLAIPTKTRFVKSDEIIQSPITSMSFLPDRFQLRTLRNVSGWQGGGSSQDISGYIWSQVLQQRTVAYMFLFYSSSWKHWFWDSTATTRKQPHMTRFLKETTGKKPWRFLKRQFLRHWLDQEVGIRWRRNTWALWLWQGLV